MRDYEKEISELLTDITIDAQKIISNLNKAGRLFLEAADAVKYEKGIMHSVADFNFETAKIFVKSYLDKPDIWREQFDIGAFKYLPSILNDMNRQQSIVKEKYDFED